jgi:hypothetical protein
MNPANTINLELTGANLVFKAQYPSVDFYHASSDVCIGVSPVPFMTEEGKDGQEHRHYALIVYGPREKLAGTQEAVQFAEAAIGMMLPRSCAVAMRVLREPQELAPGVLIYSIVAVVPFLSMFTDDETAH